MSGPQWRRETASGRRNSPADIMHSFYITPPVEGRAQLPAEEAKHASRVLRLRPGDEVCAMDGAGGRWSAVIDEISPSAVSLCLIEPLPDNESPLRLTVYQGLPKADKLEWIAQKLTELGADRLCPVKMAHCVAKSEDRDRAKRLQRLERIAAEAAKQCRRGRPMAVAPALSWDEAIRAMGSHDLLLVPWEAASGLRLSEVHAAHPQARDMGLVIGPEGGMSEEEVARLTEAGALAVTLGPRILRTETAAIAAAAVAMSLWGDV